jgi:pyridoxal phosphate enzyme (YggS family)
VVAERLNAVYARIEAAAADFGRDSGDVTLVAVSKGQPLESITAAYDAGHRDFGENRAAELAEKAQVLPADIRWHMVGHLQRNKIKLARPVVALLHSLDSPRTARAWAEGGDAPPVLVEVNIAGEPQKNGVPPAAAGDLIDNAADAGLDVRGLMTLPPLAEDPEETRPWFAGLAQLRAELVRDHPKLVDLSMGMTDDFEIAVAEGATIVRVGRAIFGPRQ